MSMEGPKRPVGKPAREMPKMADQLMPETPRKPLAEPAREMPKMADQLMPETPPKPIVKPTQEASEEAGASSAGNAQETGRGLRQGRQIPLPVVRLPDGL